MSLILESLTSASQAIYEEATGVFNGLMKIKEVIESYPPAKKVISYVGMGLEYKPIVDSSLTIIQTINEKDLFLSQPQKLKRKWENLSNNQQSMINTRCLLAVFSAVQGVLLIKSPMYLCFHRDVVFKEIRKKVDESIADLLEKKTLKAEDLSKIPPTLLDWAMNLQLNGASHLNILIKNRDKITAVMQRALSFFTTSEISS